MDSSAAGRVDADLDALQCDPQSNVLMKRNGIRGIIVAVAVLLVCVLVIALSKWNDIRMHRIPLVMKNRLKMLVQDCAVAVRSAKQAKTDAEKERFGEDARLLLIAAKKVAGPNDLSKLSNYDVGTLDSDIEVLVRGSVPRSYMLLPDDEPGGKKVMAKQKRRQQQRAEEN